MSISSKMKRLVGLMASLYHDPRRGAVILDTIPEISLAEAFCRSCSAPAPVGDRDSRSVDELAPYDPANPLWQYFQAHTEGPGIWKWVHYFDIYQRYLGKFLGTDA